MSVPNHFDIVARQREQEPPDTSSLDGILAFTVRVLKALPASERAGLHAKPGGENIAFYAPAGKMVGVSRIMYPDGTLIKILTDAGVGGANGPAWNDDDTIDVERYVPVVGTPDDPPPPDDPPDDPPPPTVDLSAILARLDVLERNALEVLAVFAAHKELLNGLQTQIDAWRDAPMFVDGNTSRSFGHAHSVKLPVKK